MTVLNGVPGVASETTSAADVPTPPGGASAERAGVSRGRIIAAAVVLAVTVLAAVVLLPPLIAGAVLLVLALLVIFRRFVFAWSTAIVLLAGVIMFVPARRYAIPIPLPFQLEPYRLVLIIVLVALVVALLTKPDFRWRPVAFGVPIAILLVTVVISFVVNGMALANAGLVETAIGGMTQLVLMLSVFVAFRQLLRSERDVMLLITFVTWAGVVVSFFAVIERVSRTNVFLMLGNVLPLTLLREGGDVSRAGVARAFGSAQHPIALAVALCLLIPLAIYLAKYAGWPSNAINRRLVYAGAVVMLFGGVLSAISRTAVVVLGVMFLVTLILHPRVAGVLFAIAFPIVLLAAVVLPKVFDKMVLSFLDVDSLVASQYTSAGMGGAGRLADLEPALREVAQRPFFGSGFGSRIVIGDEANAFILDNQFLGTLMETGAVGAIGLAVFLLVPPIMLLRFAFAQAAERRHAVLALTIAIAMSGYIAAIFFYDAFGFFQTFFILCMLLAAGRLAAHRGAEAGVVRAVGCGRGGCGVGRRLRGRVDGAGRRPRGEPMTARMSVVIPAHDEATVIGRLLGALTADPRGHELELVVVANGCTDATARVAASYGASVTVVEIDEASKIAALEAGDQAATVFPRAYVDADVVLDAAALLALADELERPGGPIVASPRLEVDTDGASWPVRQHYRIWELTDYRRTGHIGSGVYALSADGRRRFGRWPQVIADDRFVQQLFLARERGPSTSTPSRCAAPAPSPRTCGARRGSRGATSSSPASSSTPPPHAGGARAASLVRRVAARPGPVDGVRRLLGHVDAAEGHRPEADRRAEGAAVGARRHDPGDRMSAPPTDRLAHTSSRGVFVTMGGFGGKTLIQVASTVVLARLLSPADFGLVAMVTAIVGVADLVRDFGLTGAIIQSKKLSERMWMSVMWLSVALGIGLMLIIAASAPLIALLYDEERLIPLTLAIAPILLINGLTMPMQARVQRDLRFGTLASIDVVSMLVGVGLGIATAALGWGVWSLVVMSGSGQVYRLIALWVASRPRFGRPHISREVLPLVTTGGSIFGVQLLNYATKNLDNVVIGQQLGPAALGQYSRAYALYLLPMQQLNGTLGRVALPVLSKLQDDPERYRRYTRGALMIIGYLTIPVYAVAAAVSAPLIAILLGPGWQEAATIFSILAIAGVAQSIGSVLGWLYITLGRAHRQLVFFVVTRPLLIAGYFLGIWWAGTEGLALVFGLLSLALLVPELYYATSGTFVRVRDILAPILRPLILAPLCYGAAVAVQRATDGLPAIVQLTLGVAAGAVPFLASLAIPAYRRDLAQIVGFVKQVRKPPRAAAAESGRAERIGHAG